VADLDRKPRSPGEASTAPARAGLVLVSLVLVAAVANLNLAVANVALPDIGESFDARKRLSTSSRSATRSRSRRRCCISARWATATGAS
jgi:hypothetical protein